jgi:hypothetical protein
METIMKLIDLFLKSAAPAATSDDTIINGTPYDIHDKPGVRPEEVAAPVNRQGEQLSAEIRRRQLALATHYITTVSSIGSCRLGNAE